MKLLWTDVETTGLNANDHFLLEVACLVTDTNLNFLDEDGFHAVLKYENTAIEFMKNKLADDYVRDMHTRNGLWDALADGVPRMEVDAQISNYIQQFAPNPRESMLAGNSCRLDLNFLEAYLPSTYAHLHYRSIDVTSIRMITDWWADGTPFDKPDTHRAMDDNRAAIAELRHHRTQLGQ